MISAIAASKFATSRHFQPDFALQLILWEEGHARSSCHCCHDHAVFKNRLQLLAASEMSLRGC